ncbi:MAG TPA: ATP-dependent sacrificial sulfur transferase LarE [Acidobacteriaceae bacterium]|nr:ATP-dependent sacrificial sulfur transferase LarE [Acidobacteriaceae bacterium]
MDLAAKAALLTEKIRELESVLVAYSGGTDSAYLAYAAHRALGDEMLAVIADSPSMPRAELEAALNFATEHGIPTHILHTAELEKPEYARNDSQRCFHCKDELFTVMERARAELGFERLAYGMNADDQGEFRPGQKAAALHHASAPLAEAGLTKAEIRTLARGAGLSVWDKPASACLSSRIEYGRAVTGENLMQVERAEAALHRLGFAQVRVRHHGELARVEIVRADLPRALDLAMLDRMSAAVRAAGFLYVTLDTQGYRSGSMNDVLPIAEIIGSGASAEGSPNKVQVQSFEQAITVLETAVDDMSPEVLAHVAERGLAMGALDVMLAPVIMKKGRPGTLVTVLCNESEAEELKELLLRETSTLGVRMRQEKRVCLDRGHVVVSTPYGEIRVKIGSRGRDELNAAPEFEDCRAAAMKHKVAVKQVMQAALAAYTLANDRVMS